MLKSRGDRLSLWRTPFWTMTGLVTKPFVAIEIWKSWYTTTTTTSSSSSDKVKAFNLICVGVLSYSFGVINWTKVELEEMDIRVRKEMTITKLSINTTQTDFTYQETEEAEV